jgi:hypothetical protein
VAREDKFNGPHENVELELLEEEVAAETEVKDEAQHESDDAEQQGPGTNVMILKIISAKKSAFLTQNSLLVYAKKDLHFGF